MPELVKCELVSELNGLNFHDNSESVVHGIDEWPHSWSEGEISYRLNNNSMDFDAPYQKRAVTVAFRAWQIRINKLKFRRERNPDTHVDINISFQPHDKFKSKHVLAHAYYPGQGEISGDCEINDEDWDWVTNIHESTLSKPPLTTVLIHEFGHSLGLRHDTIDRASMMYPSVDLGNPSITLAQRDITRIQQRYGKRTLSKWLMDLLIRRRLFGWDFRR